MMMKRVPRSVLSLCVAVSMLSLGISAGCATRTSDASLRPISQASVVSAMAGDPNATLIIDVRDREAFEAGAIPGAVNLTLADVRMDTGPGRFEGYDRIIVYGEDPASARGRAVAKRLLRMGLDDVYFFEAGYSGWSRGR